MKPIPLPPPGQFGAIIGAEPGQMVKLTAVLALNGPVQVIVGGNRFDAYALARAVRGHTPHLPEILARVHLARAFTCYQLVTLLANCRRPGQTHPLLVVDLLTTFADESIPTAESYRLLQQAIRHLQHSCATRPVLASLRPPPQPDRAGLLTAVTTAADLVIHTPQPPSPNP